MRHCLRVRSRWSGFGQTFSFAFMDLESRHSQAGTTDPLFTPVANQNPTVNLPCPIDAFHTASWSCQRLPFFAKTPNKPKNHCKSCIGQSHQDGNAKRFASAPTKLFTGSTSLESVYKDLSVAGSLPSFKIWWLCVFPLLGSE